MRICCALIVAVAAGSAVAADTLRIEQTPFSAGNGGEFKISPLTGFAGVTGLPADLSADTFQTFCLEENELYRPGDVYDFVINTGAVQGGVAGQDPPGSGFDPLDARTAYLYFNFRLGTLAGYDYGAGRQASAGDLQQAIWFIENEGGTNNFFVALAQAAIDSGAWSGLGPVRVLNLSNGEFPNAQDQLTLIDTVPTPGAATLAVLAGVVAGRRRR